MRASRGLNICAAPLSAGVIGRHAMSYFEDLTKYQYSGKPRSGVLNVGWLGEGQPFSLGKTSEAFHAALKELCDNKSMKHFLGHHVCEFCPGASFGDPYFHSNGNGEIRVRGADGTWYVAPRLVLHYVVEHDYCPPKEFIQAVMTPSEIGTDLPLPSVIEEAFRQHVREVRGPPVTAQKIVRIVKQGIRQTHTGTPWWRFW